MRSITQKILIIVLGIFPMVVFAQEKLTFEEAVKIGLKKNVLLNQQKNQLEVNQAQKLGSYGNLMPNVNIQGQYQHQSGNQQNTTTGNLEDLETDYAGANLNANLTIFSGLRNINSITQANNQLLAQSYLLKRGTQDVVSFVAQQYLQVLLDQELLRIAEENQKAQQTLLDQIQGFYDVGSRAITDVYSQDALVKGAEVAVIRARNTLQNDKGILAQTLQLDPSQDFEVVYPSFKDEVLSYQNLSEDSLISLAVQNRADLKQLAHQAEANKAGMRGAFSGYVPNVSLFAQYGSFYYSQIPENFDGQFKTLNPSLSYGVNLTIPIFSRFQTRTQRTISRVAYENSVLDKVNREKTVKIDAQRARNNLMNAIEAYQSSLVQFQAGELALQTQRESYDLGISAQVAVAQANQTYVLGAASKAQAEVTLLFQKILLEYAIGVLRVEDFEGGQ